VANYSVDIEVALKGVEKLRQFDKLISNSVSELQKLEKLLKAVKQQNPYDVTGARRVTELDKARLNVLKETNRTLSSPKPCAAGTGAQSCCSRSTKADYSRRCVPRRSRPRHGAFSAAQH
jgi:hypothetical protein